MMNSKTTAWSYLLTCHTDNKITETLRNVAKSQTLMEFMPCHMEFCFIADTKRCQ